jgi:hypothetical protein
MTSNTAANMQCVGELVLDSKIITTCKVANMLRISMGSQEQKENHVNMCQDLQ